MRQWNPYDTPPPPSRWGWREVGLFAGFILVGMGAVALMIYFT